jgi:iron complex outermembrane receptor protein
LLVLALMGAATPAWAQDSGDTAAKAENRDGAKPKSDGGIGEIVVTAQRRAENVQKVPISINAVSGATLEQSGVTSADGLQKLAPGLTMSTVGSGFVSYTYMRGGGTNQIDPGSDPSVAFFVDEVYIGGASGLQFDLFDVDHAEVLKGPQGTLFGRNAASGAISVVTSRPSATFGGTAHLEYGSYNALLAKASITGPLTSDDSLLFRVSGAYRRRDAITQNLNGGKDPGNIDAGGMRGQLEWRSGPFTALLSADFYKARNGQTNQFIASANVASLVDPTLAQPTDQSFYAHYYDLIGYENQDVHDLSARFELETPIGTITSLSAYRHNTFSRVQDQDATKYSSYNLFSREVDKTFSQELRLVGDVAGNRLHYVAGLFYYHGNINSFFRVDAGPAFPTAVVRGTFASDGRTLLTDSYAVFGQATYDLSDQFSLTVGGRYTKDDKEDQRQVKGFLAAAPFMVDPTASFKAFTPSATLQFKPREGLMAYLSYRRGFKSGGFQGLLPPTAAIANIPFLPEKVASYEFGIKSTFFDRRLLANVALFRSDITDQQISRTVTPTQIFIDNAGSTRTTGVDFEVTVKPVSQLTLTAQGTYQHARFRTYQSGALNFAGHSQLRSPDFTGYFSAEYAIPLGSGSLTLHGDFSTRSRTFYDQANSTAVGLFAPAYQVGNLRMTLAPGGSPVEISAFVKNVGDTHYYQNIAANGQSGLAVPGEPRMYGAAIDLRF